MNKNWKIETKLIQGGFQPKDGDPRVLPIVQSTTYKYDNAQSVADLFDLKRDGFFYTRLSNPTVAAFEEKMALLEGGVAAVATGAGQMANALSVMNLAKCGENIVSTSGLYGGTVSMFANTLRKMGIEVRFIATDADDEEIEKAIDGKTKAVFGEVLANPALTILDIEKFANIAHKHGLPLVVDNTFPTPYLCRPFEFGADIVTHSASKYIDGHALSIGGVIIEKGDFNWKNGNFPEFAEPDPAYHGLVYTDTFAAMPYSVKLRAQYIRDLGAGLAPFNAFLSNVGLETLHVRMDRHCQNALALARFLEKHPKVSWVNYPGLPSSPQYALAQKYMPKGASGVLCFGVKGGKAAGEIVMDSLKLAAIVVHVADVRTGVLHPASMTHRQLSDEELAAAGVSPDMIRLSAGLENIDDLIADFDQALNRA